MGGKVKGNCCRYWLRRHKGAAFGLLRALAPPSPSRLPDEVFGEKTESGKVAEVRIAACLKLAGGSFLLAALVYGILAAPGLLTDTASTVPIGATNARVYP
jgi:hypothetical protein